MNGEAALIAAAADERPAAPADRIAALFDAHHARMYRLARRLSPNAEDARDALQETFLRAAQRPGSIPVGIGPEEAWLVRVLVNICRDRWRRTATRRRLDPIAQHTDARDPESILIAGVDLWCALDALSPRRRAVLVLHELDGLAVRDVAAMLGLAAVTVRWHLSRARRQLRGILGQEGQERRDGRDGK